MVKIITSLEEFDIDQWNGEDADNSVLANGPVVEHPDDVAKRRAIATENVKTSTPVIYFPLKRNIKQGMIGPDCYAVKRALAKAGHGTWGRWGIKKLFGPFAAQNLKNFQKEQGLLADGEYGSLTHKKLAPYFDDYGRSLMGQVDIVTVGAKEREIIKQTCLYAYSKRDQIHYTESSLRMQGVREKIRPPRVPSYEDCSSFSTWTYWVSGAPDPNGLNYDGFGYTGTLYPHGTPINVSDLQVGDLVFYGGNQTVPGHVAVFVGNGLVVSHGSEEGPLLLPVGYRGVLGCRRYIKD